MKNPLKNLIKHQDKLIDSLKKTNDKIDELIDELEKLNSSLDKIEEEKIGFKVGINKDGIRSFFCFKENSDFEDIIKELKSGESINIEKV